MPIGDPVSFVQFACLCKQGAGFLIWDLEMGI
jgi:hypothetical protein